MDNELKYTITLNEKQLGVMKIALEEYFRVRIGQFRDLADDLAFQGCDYENSVQFNAALARRNAGLELLDGAFRLMRPDFYSSPKTEEALIAEDMWDCIKHEMWKRRPYDDEKMKTWCVDAAPPLNLSGEPMIKVGRSDE